MTMRRSVLGLVAGLAGLIGLTAAATAAPGFATGNVNLRAGPGTGYPQVVVVPNAAPVEIFGCLQGYGWCDVGFNGVRGWVSSGYLQYSSGGRRVPFARYYGQAGVPVVGFEFGNYWGEHYRDRPWFTDRDRWGGPPRGRGYGPGRDYDRAYERGRDREFDRGPDRGFDRGPERGFDRGPDRGPERGFDRGADRGFDRGPERDRFDHAPDHFPPPGR